MIVRNTPLKDTKIDKYIEIVTIPTAIDVTEDRKNVGIELDEITIFEILSTSYEKVILTIIETKEDLENLVSRKPDLVFSGIKYFDFDEQEIWLSDYLKEHDIYYITSNKEALNSEYDKNRAKEIVKLANINTANFFTTQPNEHPKESSLPITFPLFLKPITGGDSRGINADSIVFDFIKYQTKVLDIYNKLQSRTLVENYLSGREYSVSILENESKNILMILPVEIIAGKNKNGHRILDYDAKINNLEEVIAVTDEKLHQELCDVAINSFRALGGKTMGRIDIKTGLNGVLNFIEANFMPGLGHGYFYRSFMLNENTTYEQMILKVADAGLSL
ncbi:D-alanine--D-alanine ligase [Sulfurovum sp. enrichment culture clone C5]|uniref:D-alanine--D-alanine ligase n=1 Tax=Sulfurovum sp. enrichment culture clone C5 TaxID=497650 RepID=A0A0S4XNV8_9BACT|nr:D-alanine--D-alanine ligase [Sulfurovum sp. enrichment culture clone C5]